MIEMHANVPGRQAYNPAASARICAWGRIVVFVVLVVVSWTMLRESYRTPAISVSSGVQGPVASNPGQQEPRAHENALAVGDDFELASSVDCPALQRLRSATSLAKRQIWDAWNVSNYPNFLAMMHVPRASWDLQKAKFIDIVLRQLDNGTSSGNHTFVAGFSGSSVTAGHDNFFSEAFPAVFERAMRPVFDAMGLPIVVRNHALGNNPCYPYDACVDTHMGDDLDLLVWEQSMNCGRASRPLDTFTRSAVRMRRHPTVLYMLSGTPSWQEKDCKDANTTRSSEHWPLSSDEYGLLNNKLREVADLRAFMTTMEFLKADDGFLFHKFDQAAPMGQSLFPCEVYKCSGPYGANFSTKSTGGGAPWHPGKLGHQLRGENLAYFMMAMLEDAAESISTIACGESAAAAPGSLRRLSGEAAALDAVIRQLDFTNSKVSSHTVMNAIAHKHTAVQGQLGPAAMLDAVAKLYIAQITSRPMPGVPLSYDVPETANPPTCYTDYEPRMSHALADQLIQPLVNWTKGLSFLDAAAVAKAEKRGLGYIDKKIIYVSTGKGATLSMHIHPQHPSPIWICEVQKGFAQYQPPMGDLLNNVDVLVDYDVGASNHTSRKPVKFDLSAFSDQCYRTTAHVQPGEHVLRIVQRGDTMVNIAYVIIW